jgi:hypothetical protein
MSVELTAGHLYRLRSRNLPYGVYDGKGGFTGIREKFGDLYLFTEYDHSTGEPYGTATALEDLGPSEGDNLYEFLAAAELRHGRGVGYGSRPGDEPRPGLARWRKLT